MHKRLTATVREQEDRLKEQHDMSKRLHARLQGLALRTDATGDLRSSMPSTHPPHPPPAPHNTVERIHLPSSLHSLSPGHIVFFPNNQDDLEDSHPDTEDVDTPLRPAQAAEAAESQDVLHPYVPYRSSLHGRGAGGSLWRGGGRLSGLRNEAEERPFFEILQNIVGEGEERERDLGADQVERIDELFGAFSEVVCARRSLRDSATYQERQKKPTMSKETQKRLDSARGLCCLEARRQTSELHSLPGYQRWTLSENLKRLVDQEALLRRHVNSFISHKSSSVCLDPAGGGDAGERAEGGGGWGGGEGERARKIGASRGWVGGVGGVGEEAMDSESVGWLLALASSPHMEATKATSCARVTSSSCTRVTSSIAHRSRGLMASDERTGWMDGWRMIGRDSTGKNPYKKIQQKKMDGG